MSTRSSESGHSSAGDTRHAKGATGVACATCRKRKLGCDKQKPSCSQCKRLQIACSYDHLHRKRGPKKGALIVLREKLARTEALLNTGDAGYDERTGVLSEGTGASCRPLSDEGHWSALETRSASPPPMFAKEPRERPTRESSKVPLCQMTIDYLERVYFQKIHALTPFIHIARFKEAICLAKPLQPPLYLRCAMWALAASLCPQYINLQERLYRRSRSLLELAELECSGNEQIAVLQAWALVARYELLNRMSYSALLTTGRAVRMAQNMGLFRLDRSPREREILRLPDARDWTEAEERRRTFWAIFCLDRFVSIAKRLPVLIDERDIMTNLPSLEASYQQCKGPESWSLLTTVNSEDLMSFSSFAILIVLTNFCGTILSQSQSPVSDDTAESFWGRQQSLEIMLSKLSLSLTDVPAFSLGGFDLNIVLSKLIKLTCSIYLRDRVSYGLRTYAASQERVSQTETKCFSEASQVADIVSIVSHLDLRPVDTLVSFLLYEAARVLLQELGQHRNAPIRSSLQFVLDTLRGLSPPNCSKNVFLQALTDDFPQLNEMSLDPRGQLGETNMVSEIDHSTFDDLVNNRGKADGQVGTTSAFDCGAVLTREGCDDSFEFQDFGNNMAQEGCTTWSQESCEQSLGLYLAAGVPLDDLATPVTFGVELGRNTSAVLPQTSWPFSQYSDVYGYGSEESYPWSTYQNS
ncbi:fungal-specific transcription factor domain-containing protein [Xylogone sp. PMI_703]|nr:fungal-specific transcription factor domain-containing protein [Xylogone sp. PMI_703]